MPRTNITAKAGRMIADGKVSLISTKASIVKIEGDTETYKVIVYGNGSAECPCRSTVKCSHALAAELIVGASR